LTMEENLDIPLSKTRLKKLAKEVEGLAKHLATMPEAAFAGFELEVDIREEAILARETVGRGSHKRQIKRLAAVLRSNPAYTERLRERLTALDQVAAVDRRQFHRVEDFRDRLCDAERFQEAYEELLVLCPAIERKVIARLAQSVHQHNDRRAARELFRRLRDALAEISA